MRICIHKMTKRIIEMQGGEDDRPDLSEMRLNTLKQNAINAGYIEDEIDVKWVTDEEWAAIQEANKPVPDPNIPILANLAAIDLKSIRAIRAGDIEWLKKYEAQAIAERAKLKT